MVALTDEEYENYAEENIRNIIQDETARIIDSRTAFSDWAHAYAIIKEEVEEVNEEVEALNDCMERLWKLVREDAPDEKLIERMDIMKYIAINAINEAKQVAAVSLKAIEQLKKDSCTTAR